MAAVCCASTRRRAMVRRRRDIFSRTSPRGSAAGAATTAGAGGAGAAAAGATGAGCGVRAVAAATSSLVTRPLGPLPVKSARSSPASAAMRRATGVADPAGPSADAARPGAEAFAGPAGPSADAARRARGGRRVRSCGCVVVRRFQQGDDLPYAYVGALSKEDVAQDAALLRLDLQVDLVGFQLNEHVTGGDDVPFLFAPGADGRFDHGFTQFRYFHFQSHSEILTRPPGRLQLFFPDCGDETPTSLQPGWRRAGGQCSPAGRDRQ